MVTTHNLGFPRIGEHRELKFAQEGYWRGESSSQQLEQVASDLRAQSWKVQRSLDFSAAGDFSLYDHVLDMSVTLGNLPERVNAYAGSELDRYFLAARGRSAQKSVYASTHAGEMTKWFDTNYHYIVPEFTSATEFSLNFDRFSAQLSEAAEQHKKQGNAIKPVIVGPLTYLWLGKSKDASNRLQLLERLIPVYQQLLQRLAERGVEWVQIDEPILVTQLQPQWRCAFEKTYHALKNTPLKILLATYFGELKENLRLVCNLPVDGIHVDAINARTEVRKLVDWLPAHKVVSLGVINGRNIWKSNLEEILYWLKPLHEKLKDRLWIAPSCSLLHVPVNLENESTLDVDVKQWLAFAIQKLNELKILAKGLNKGEQFIAAELAENKKSIVSRASSTRVHNPAVKTAVDGLSRNIEERDSDYSQREKIQAQQFKLPQFPTTTIGSFPQTEAIRKTRLRFKKNEITQEDYINQMKREIQYVIQKQEALGLDVLVHGEAERNDMVEYFGEQLDGFVFSQLGWVQSYGSRCVKPPILFGDISRAKPMTVQWATYAQSLTEKPVKGMLTGPVTVLNWSFVRDDQPRAQTCYQLALAIREEVLDLEAAGIQIIQIDEAALREGLPLRKSQWQNYLDWAVAAFKVSANGVKDKTQIHTHMCYSEFNDIIEDIARMDADVITIETSRSDMELLDAFEDFNYPNQIGPGVYDIHSPNTPKEEHITQLMNKAAQRIP